MFCKHDFVRSDGQAIWRAGLKTEKNSTLLIDEGKIEEVEKHPREDLPK